MFMVSSVSYFDFIHRYKDAPKEVTYLAHLHRHLLNIETTVEVFTTDREIEFYMMKDRIDNALKEHTFDENASCEDVCSFIMGVITEAYGKDRYRKVKVQEDNNGFATLVKEAGE